MIKNTFITLTVSLMTLGMFGVIQPQFQPIENSKQPIQTLVDSEITEIQFHVEDEVTNSLFLNENKVNEEVDEVNAIVEVATTTSIAQPQQPVVVTKEQPKVVETTKEEPKTQAEQPKPVAQQSVEPVASTLSTVSSIPEATWELEIARLTNIERQKAGLSILKYNTSLEVGANIRANEIITHFSHTRPDGTRFLTAFKDLKYRNLGENLGNGFRTPEAVMKAWMNSESHRANILKPEYQEISVAIVLGEDGKYRWVQIFYRGQ